MELEYNGFHYTFTKLTVMEQFNLSRKLLPMLSGMQNAVISGASETEAFDKMANAISAMSDEDSKNCINGFLKSIKRKTENGIFPLIVDGNIMYNDIDLASMLFLVFKSMQFNLSDFFGSLPRLLQDAGLKQNEQ